METWPQLCYFLKKKCVPEEHVKNKRLRMSTCKQGHRSPTKFFNELEDLSYKANMHHFEHSLRTQLMAYLNQPICDVFKVQSIRDINTLVHKAYLVHNQLQRRRKESYASTVTKSYVSNSSPSSNTSLQTNSSM